MASPAPPAANGNGNGLPPPATATATAATTTPILEEGRRLSDARSLLASRWRDEVLLYEGGGGPGLDDGRGEGATRNRPNPSGTVANVRLFPYHDALYPLLDCYDSIRDDGDGGAGSVGSVVRPSPAPRPHDFDGHRRSRRSVRLDRHGVRIEELSTLEGHLPNSAWAVARLLPMDRRERFREEREEEEAEEARRVRGDADDGSQGDDDDGAGEGDEEGDDEGGGGGDDDDEAAPPPPGEDPDGNEIQDGASRHSNNRYWNVLMDPRLDAATGAVAAGGGIPDDDGVSVPPAEEDDGAAWEDVAGEGAEGGGEGAAAGDDVDADDHDDDWEDVEEEEDGEEDPGAASGARLQNSRYARDFSFLGRWQRSLVEERSGVVVDDDGGDDASKPPHSPLSAAAAAPSHSPEGLFRSAGASPAVDVLLRVLKHSLSDLQREFRLSRAVVLLMADWGLCDIGNGNRMGGESASNDDDGGGGIDALRRLLAIVSSEYVAPCGGYCHEWYISNGGIGDNDDEFEDVLNESATLNRPNYYCSDWWEFLGALVTLLSCGIAYMTRGHADVLCAFAMEEVHRASGAGDDVADGGAGKAYLKQNLYFLNYADQPEAAASQDGGAGRRIRTNLVLSILSAVRRHAVSDRTRLRKLLEARARDDGPDGDREERISQTLASFRCCVDIMVDVGERCLLRLPPNVPSRSICGMVVRGLVEAYVDGDEFPLRAERPLSYLAPKRRSVIDPLRYSEAAANASNNPLLDRSRSRCQKPVRAAATDTELIGYQPPQDVQDIVKWLFMKDLVDLQVSGCGYGDFLCWCHLPLHPHSLLFDYISNFPTNLSNPDAGAQQQSHWVVDEDGTELDHAHLSARYDFTLLVFLRQWNSPWTPEGHLSYSVPYRRAVSTLALCAHRYHMPADICILVNSFLPRSWWPDDRRCCWYRDSQLRQLKQEFNAKISSRQSNWDSTSNPKPEMGKKSPPLLTCPGCQVAMAYSKEHLNYLHRDGHRRYCGLPPFRAPFHAEDNALCREIFGEKEDICRVADENDAEGVEEGSFVDGDDDGSWESVDSIDELEDTVRSRSEVIFSFFNNKSYKLQRRETLPFANFF